MPRFQCYIDVLRNAAKLITFVYKKVMIENFVKDHHQKKQSPTIQSDAVKLYCRKFSSNTYPDLKKKKNLFSLNFAKNQEPYFSRIKFRDFAIERKVELECIKFRDFFVFFNMQL